MIETTTAKPSVSVLGAFDGLADRLDSQRCIGNGQVPAVVALAWEILSGVEQTRNRGRGV